MLLNHRLIEGDFRATDIMREAAGLCLAAPLGYEDGRQVLEGDFQGWMWMEELYPGLVGSACDMSATTNVLIAKPLDRSVMISVLLKGSHGFLRTAHGETVPSLPGHSQILGAGETVFCERALHAGERWVRAGVVIQPQFLDSFSDAVSSAELGALEQFMLPGFRTVTLRQNDMLTQLSRTIVEAPYVGTLGALFRESAIVQLLAQSLWLLKDARRVPHDLPLRHYDAVLRAQAILDGALAHPPGTIALARDVGLDRNALQNGFKTVFGTTIFGYVRAQRLKMARILLQEYGVGAAEAAYRVGFKSASAFSAAYRQMFGVAPSVDGASTRY